MILPDEAHKLFELPPEEFTGERDRIAKDLKRQGDAEAAAAVKALKRPSLAAYALNLVAHKTPELIDRLLESGDRLGSATSRSAMEEAKSDRQAAIAEVTAQAASLLEELGRPMTAQVREKVTETLLAVATDPDTRELLKAGQLLKEAEPTGFGGPVPVFEPSGDKPSAGKQSDRAGRLRAEADAKLAEARKAAADSKRALEESRQLAEAAAAAKERAEKLGNIARKAEEVAKSKLAEAKELESR
ncbi:MAG TPA: hypothetical protein VHJ78_10155 [Actinomycetota bacterium]|nr:hypothetical protein [Actinomycetota bacterium]